MILSYKTDAVYCIIFLEYYFRILHEQKGYLAQQVTKYPLVFTLLQLALIDYFGCYNKCECLARRCLIGLECCNRQSFQTAVNDLKTYLLLQTRKNVILYKQYATFTSSLIFTSRLNFSLNKLLVIQVANRFISFGLEFLDFSGKLHF